MQLLMLWKNPKKMAKIILKNLYQILISILHKVFFLLINHFYDFFLKKLYFEIFVFPKGANPMWNPDEEEDITKMKNKVNPLYQINNQENDYDSDR